MRILIIHRSFALVGGAERVITDKANYLANEGHQLMLVSYEQGNHPLPYELHQSVQYRDLDCRFFTLSKYSALKHLYLYFRLKKQFRNNLRLVVHEFKPEVVVLASDWQTLMGAVIDSVNPVPVIAEFHNTYDYVMRKVGTSEGWLKAKLTQLYYRQTIKNLGKCAQLVVLTDSDARGWRQHFNNVTVIPNPVTLYPDVIDDIPKDPGRIIYVGRFNHEKRIDRLITAFSMIADKYPDWHVDIFGDGNEKENLLRQIAEMKLEDRIIIHEPTKAIYDEYKRSEMLVLCSEHEASPLVLVEAQTSGLTIYASKDKITNEVVLDKDNIKFISLNDGEQKWCDSILEDYENGVFSNLDNRKNKIKIIQDSGYDIKVEAKKIEDIFSK